MSRYFSCWGLFVALCAAACADSEPLDPAPSDAGTMAADAASNPDATPVDGGTVEDGGLPPGDTGFRIRAAHLSPAAGTSQAGGRRVQGGLTPSIRPSSQSPSHRLTGGLIPSRPSR